MKHLLRALLFLLILGYGSQEVTFAQTNPGYIGPRANTADDPANGIYVSPSGNDATANGSKDRPYKSINTALAAAQPGGTIVLRSGTYYEYNSVRIRKPNITIKSAKGEWAVIDLPLDHDPDRDKQSSTIRFDVYDDGSSGGKLQSIEVIGGFYAVSFETKWDWGQPDRSGASNIIIEDCILHDSRNDVIKLKPNCDNITIRYNEIYNSGRAFIGYSNFNTGDRNAEGIDNVNSDNMHVHNNHIHDICSTGVYAKGGATDALIENNLIERPYAAGIAIGFHTNLEFFDTVVNPQYYENINGVARNNLIIDAGWEGIGLYASKDAQVYNNTLVNADCGVSKYHSAIYFGITDQDGQDGYGHPANINPNIHHNVVRQPSSFNNPMIEIRYSDSYGGASALSGAPVMNDNCYYIEGRSAFFNDNRGSKFSGGLAAWKTHIGSDNGSVEVNPALNTTNYMTTNAQCTGMGIQFPLNKENPTGTDAPALFTQTVTFLQDGTLRIESPAAETVQGYSLTGALLFNLQKPAGNASYSIDQPKGAMIIIKGNSGWTKKVIAQ